MLRICRICLAKTEYFLELGTTEKSLRAKLVYCVPEIDKSINEDAVICKTCSCALDVTYKFLQRCLQTEKRINDIRAKAPGTSDAELEIIESLREPSAKRKKFDRASCDKRNEKLPSNESRNNSCNSKSKAVLSSIDKNLVSILKSNSSIFNFEYHLEKGMAEVNTWKCDSCDLKFDLETSLEEHKETHKEPPRIDELNCRYCQKHFSRAENLLFHEKMHDKSSLFQCNTCSETFDNQNALMLHLELHAQRDNADSVEECELCDRYFHDNCLETHEEEHLKENGFKCIYCHTSFDKKGFLIYHLKLHDADEKASAVGKTLSACTVCNKTVNLENVTDLKIEITDTAVDTKKVEVNEGESSARETSSAARTINRVDSASLKSEVSADDVLDVLVKDEELLLAVNSLSGEVFDNTSLNQITNDNGSVNNAVRFSEVVDNCEWEKKDNLSQRRVLDINVMKSQISEKLKPPLKCYSRKK